MIKYSYSCERCGERFIQKNHFDIHNRQKTPCENNSDTFKELVSTDSLSDEIEELNIERIVENEEVKTNTMNSQSFEFSELSKKLTTKIMILNVIFF